MSELSQAERYADAKALDIIEKGYRIDAHIEELAEQVVDGRQLYCDDCETIGLLEVAQHLATNELGKAILLDAAVKLIGEHYESIELWLANCAAADNAE